jgi:hypothetical protein
MELQRTNQQTTSAALWKDTNAATVALLRNNRFDQVSKSVSNKVSDLLDCEPITSLISHAGEGTVKAYVEAELIKLAGNFNGNPALNLKDYQVPVIADMLIQNYKWESIEDFTLCFRRASCGMYGEIYRIDGAVIGQWLARYLDEKYDALEQRKAKEKQQDKNPVSIVKLTAEHAAEYGKRYMENASKKKETNEKTNAYERYKLENEGKEISDDHLRKILRQEYPKATPEQIEEVIKSRSK